MAELNLKPLETRGFVVIPGFLSPAEVEYFRGDFDSRKTEENKNYNLKNASSAANNRFALRVNEVLARVRADTTLRVDAPQGASYFATGASTGINFPWHQDHESFFVLQNHFDYLNFYVPIVKPDPAKSNLSVVPFDVLERESPRLYQALFRGGATRFPRIGNRRLAVCDDTGWCHVIERDLELIAETPQLTAGDLLLLRGDVVHRTQDTLTERVAMSFRVSNDSTVIKRSRLAAGGMHKALMMANNPGPYQRMFLAFDKAHRDEVPLHELKQLMNQVQPRPIERRREFMKLLLREKRRAGLLSQFVASTSAMYALGKAGKLLGRYQQFRQRRAG